MKSYTTSNLQWGEKHPKISLYKLSKKVRHPIFIPACKRPFAPTQLQHIYITTRDLYNTKFYHYSVSTCKGRRLLQIHFEMTTHIFSIYIICTLRSLLILAHTLSDQLAYTKQWRVTL